LSSKIRLRNRYKRVAAARKRRVARRTRIPPSATATPRFDVSNTEFTNHAIERLIERAPEVGIDILLENPERTAMELLAESSRYEMNPAERVVRIINNGFVEARYFSAKGLMFVVVEEDHKFKVLTVEVRK